MLEKFVERRFVLERFRSSPVGPHIDGFAESLVEAGYAWQTGASCLRHAVHLGRWSEAQDLPVEAIDEGMIEAFEAHLPSCGCPFEHAGSHERAGVRVRVFLEYLREIGVASPAIVDVPADPIPLIEFRDWMRRHRGVSDWTVRAYSRPVRGLLERLGEDPGQYTPRALREVVLSMAAGHGSSKAQASRPIPWHRSASAIRMRPTVTMPSSGQWRRKSITPASSAACVPRSASSAPFHRHTMPSMVRSAVASAAARSRSACA